MIAALYVIGGFVLTLISALLKRADDKVCAWVNDTHAQTNQEDTE